MNIEFSRLRYEWHVDIGRASELYQRDPPAPPAQWTLRCQRATYEPIAPNRAIDGEWLSPFQLEPPPAGQPPTKTNG